MNKRQSELIKVLEEHNAWITSVELGQIVGCSNKTVQNDIKYLNDLLPKGWHILSKKGYGIKLKKPLNKNLDLVAKKIDLTNLDNSSHLKYFIMDKIINNKGYTLEKLSKELFYNIKTIQKYLNLIEEELALDNLTLIRNPLTIIGPELMIRLNIYKHKRSIYGEPYLFNHFYPLYKKHRLAFMKSELSSKIKIGTLPFIKLLILVDIFLSRIEKGHLLPTNNDLDFILELDFYNDFLSIFDKIEFHRKIKLNKTERINLFFAFVYSDYVHIYNSTETEAIYNAILKKDAMYIDVRNFIDLLENSFQLIFLSDKQFTISIYDLFKKRDLRNHYPDFKHAGCRPSSIEVINKYNNEYNKIVHVTEQWIKNQTNSKPKFTHDTLSSLVILVEQYKLYHRVEQKHVLFIYSESQDLQNLTLSTLRNEFGYTIKFESVSLEFAHDYFNKDYDLIITDTHLPILDHKHLLINKLLTSSDISNIRDAIKN